VHVDVESGDVTTRKGSALQAESANDFGIPVDATLASNRTHPVTLSERSESKGPPKQGMAIWAGTEYLPSGDSSTHSSDSLAPKEQTCLFPANVLY